MNPKQQMMRCPTQGADTNTAKTSCGNDNIDVGGTSTITLKFREATTRDDFEMIWPILNDVISRGDTYAYNPDMTKDETYHVWMEYPRMTWLVEEDEEEEEVTTSCEKDDDNEQGSSNSNSNNSNKNKKILGTYYIKTNASGPGKHVCNCGYMVAREARGKGVATLMCEHSKQLAIQLGYKAMQFNFVASTNVGAVRLWKKLGYDIVGTLPGAFNHPTKGYVDAYVMFQWLAGKKLLKPPDDDDEK